jgi:LuxR family maltose regulon positive regulatory protein
VIVMGSWGPPSPLRHELARPHLAARLGRRWSVPVTTIVAGAGFGKSTLLAQALRAEAAAPVGIDAWVSCRAGHERDADLAACIVGALGGPSFDGDPLAAVLGALRATAPVDVCVVIDDVHLLGGESTATRLLGDVVRGLPANAHLVLAGREPPPIPLARLRAADDVVELTADDLAFTSQEIAHLAADVGRDPRDADGYGGWPALVRVALAARRDVATGFAREEVLHELAPDARRALYVLALAGTATDEFVGAVVGAPVDLAALAERVPLIAAVGAAHRAHDLWNEVLPGALDADDAARLRRRVVDELLSAGDPTRAGEAARIGGDLDALDVAALGLVRSTISVLPVELSTRWLAGVSIDADQRPGLALLHAAARAAGDDGDASVDHLLDDVAATYRARGDAGAEVAALAVATVAAQSRGDVDRLVALAGRTSSVPGAEDDPIVQVARGAVAGVVAEMSGDPEAAVAAFATAPLHAVPPALALSPQRFLMHCLLLAGRADDAVVVADQALATNGNRHSQQGPAFARWLAGDPSGFADDAAPIDPDHRGSARDVFVAGAFHAVIRASWGLRLSFQDVVADNARDAAVVANARAAHAVLAHDEAAARDAITEVAARFGGDPVGGRHLRRFLALGYMLDPDRRAEWDAVPLGPSHGRARAVARALLGLRAGRPVAAEVGALHPPHVFTVLPLPWSVELACRLHGGGSPLGAALAGYLLERAGCRAHRELRTATTSDDTRLARDATALLSRLPVAPTTELGIGVLGPLEVCHDGMPSTDRVLRRARVRELLAILVLEPNIARDRVVELLWPDLDPDAGGRNLRVTLTHLHRLLEPGRAAGEATFHVRADAITIRLVDSPRLRVDVWELRRLSAAAAAARDAGDVGAAVALLTEAAALSRGTPFVDLDRVAGFDAEVEALRMLVVTTLLELAALHLTAGSAGPALACAERALVLDPYLEAAHRLAIAATAQRGDGARTTAVVERTCRRLDELGVSPEPATEMLIRSAMRRSQVALASSA